MQRAHHRGRRFSAAGKSSAIFVVASLAASAARATDRYWVDGTAFWEVPVTNWNTSPDGTGATGVPVNGDRAFIYSANTITVTRDHVTPNITAPGLSELDVSGTGSLNVVTLVQTETNQMYASFEGIGVGTGGHGAYSQTDAINNVGATMEIGESFNSVGTYTLNGSSSTAQLNVTSNLVLAATDGARGTLVANSLSAIVAGSLSVAAFGTGQATFTSSGQVSLGTLTIGNTFGTGGVGTYTQNGGFLAVHQGMTVNPGSRFTQTFGATPQITGPILVNGGTFSSFAISSSSPGSITVRNGGLFSLTSDLSLVSNYVIDAQNGGSINFSGLLGLGGPGVTNARLVLEGGRVSAGTVSIDTGATVQFSAGTLAITGAGGFDVSDNGLLGNVVDLTTAKAVEVTNATNIASGGAVIVDGGTFITGSLPGLGILQLNSGTFRLTASDLTVNSSGGLFSGILAVNPAMRIDITNAHIATIASGAMLYMSGGTFAAAGGITNNGEIQLASGAARLSGGVLNNNGLIDGNGRIDNKMFNNAGATIRAGAADHVVITASNNTNDGTIQLLGGIVEYQQNLTNGTGSISGRGTIMATTGLTNQASIALSGGPSDVYGALTNTNSARVLITGGAEATFHNNVTNQAGSQVKVSTASIATFLAPVSGLAAFTGAGTTIFESTTSPGPLLTSGTSIVETTGNLSATSIRESALIVRGMSNISPDGSPTGTSVLQSLTIDGTTDAWTGKLDLTNNKLILDYSGASPIATIANQIKSGASASWTGNGITSATAHGVAIDGANLHKTALGYGEAGSLAISSFGGQSVDSTSVLVRYTWSGDANLDGLVNALDFNALASNFGGASAKFWTQGDFNYDGIINTADFTALASNFNQPAFASPALGTLNSEPTVITLATFAAFVLAPRRRH